MPAGEQRLLLVAAGQRPHRRLERGRRPRRMPPIRAGGCAPRPGRLGRAAAAGASEAARCSRVTPRLGRMPSLLRSSVTRQMPAATAVGGPAETTFRPPLLSAGVGRRSPPSRRAISFCPAPSRPGQCQDLARLSDREAASSRSPKRSRAAAIIGRRRPAAAGARKGSLRRRPSLRSVGLVPAGKLGRRHHPRPLRSTVARSQRSSISRKRCET